MQLTSKQRKYLEGLANELEPVVRIGKSGVTRETVQAIRENLVAQELIKVKVLENAHAENDEVADEIVAATGATLIRTIGRVIILFKSNPEKKRRIEVDETKRAEMAEAEERAQAAARRKKAIPADAPWRPGASYAQRGKRVLQKKKKPAAKGGAKGGR